METDQTKQKKKILFLITKSNWGGAQRYVFDLATNLPADEYCVVVALGGDGILKEKLESAGVSVRSISDLQRDVSVFKEFKSFWAIVTLLRQEQPDIIHLNSSKAGLIGALAGRLTRVPHIIFTAHGWFFNEDRSVLSRFFFKCLHYLTVLCTHQTIAVSHTLKAQMNWPLAKRKMTVIHNGRAVADFLPRETARLQCVEKLSVLKPYEGDLWTGTIAELHPVKGHTVMLEAMAKLTTQNPDRPIRHIIIGEGERRTALEAQIKEKQLENRVFLLGHIHEAATLLKAFDIFVLPSYSEALGYTLIEATQAGLPIIASRVGGIPEIITHNKDGLLFPAGDSTALAALLTEVIDNPARRAKLAEAAARRAGDFSLTVMVRQTTNLY